MSPCTKTWMIIFIPNQILHELFGMNRICYCESRQCIHLMYRPRLATVCSMPALETKHQLH